VTEVQPRGFFANPALPFYVLGALLACLAGKLVYVQIVKEKQYSSEVNSIVEKRLRLVAPRGRILDAQGTVLAGTRGIVHLVADGRELRKIEERYAAKQAPHRGAGAVPAEIQQKRAEYILQLRTAVVADLAAVLARTVGSSTEFVARARDVAARLGRMHKNKSGNWEPAVYIPIARKLSPDEETNVRAVLKMHGVSGAFAFEEDFERTYPAGASASAMVGYFGAREERSAAPKTAAGDNHTAGSKATEPASDRVGRGGIEQYYEERLRGTAGASVVQRAPFVDGGFMDLDCDIPPVPGADIYLTIDSKITSVLHEEALRAFTNNKCDAVAAVALDAYTGRVLAMASVPGFDPNAAPGVRNYPLNNYAAGFSYEPGSAIKPFTVAAALESGAISPTDEFDVNFPGGWNVPKRSKPIRDSHVFNGSLDVTGILQRSSNIGAVKIGQKAGPQTIRNAFLQFGFNEKTGVELPIEGRVSLPGAPGHGAWDVPNTLSSVSFGYQFYVNALRFAAAYASLVNGGMRVEPRLVDRIVYADGHVERPVAPPPRRVLSEDTTRIVRDMLQTVVTAEHGTAKRSAEKLAKEGFVEVDALAGKTGTAVIHKNPSNINGTFAVFGPMPDPRVIVVFTAFNSSVRFAGDVVVEPAMRALARSLRALGLTTPGPRSVDLTHPGTPVIAAAGVGFPRELTTNNAETAGAGDGGNSGSRHASSAKNNSNNNSSKGNH
jgi:cell division protein FtsI (penicillin-binding protein 3)